MNPQLQQREQELNRMIQQRRALEAFERFYDEDVVMQENSDPPTVGKEANRQRERSFFQNLSELKDVELVSSAVNDDHSFSEWRYDMVFEDGHRSTLEEIAVREWEDGKVVKERFYYERHHTARTETPDERWSETTTPERAEQRLEERPEGTEATYADEVNRRPGRLPQSGVPQERLSAAPEDLGTRALEEMTEAPAIGSRHREPTAVAVEHADAVASEAAAGAIAGVAPPLSEPTSSGREGEKSRTMKQWADSQARRMSQYQDDEIPQETAEASDLDQESEDENR